MRRKGGDSAEKGRRWSLPLIHLSQHNQHKRLLTHTERTPHYTCIVPVDCCADPVGPATEEARCTAQRTRQALGTEALLLFTYPLCDLRLHPTPRAARACTPFVGCLSESFSADCHRTKV